MEKYNITEQMIADLAVKLDVIPAHWNHAPLSELSYGSQSVSKLVNEIINTKFAQFSAELEALIDRNPKYIMYNGELGISVDVLKKYIKE